MNDTTMLYQVVMDEMNGPSVVSNLEMAFLAFTLFVGLVSIVFGNNVGTFVGLTGLFITVGYFLLLSIPWDIVQWGLARGGIVGNLGICAGTTWLLFSFIFIFKSARSIAKDYRVQKSGQPKPQ